MTTSPRTATRLEHLFDAELEYRPGMEPIVPIEEGEGSLTGSGDGTIAGPRVDGSISWTLFEHTGETACAMNPTAVIETRDGATIRVEGRGWGRRPDAGSTRWTVGAALRFLTEDERYRWLNDTLGVWEGEFDAEAHRARYRAYLQRTDDAKEDE